MRGGAVACPAFACLAIGRAWAVSARPWCPRRPDYRRGAARPGGRHQRPRVGPCFAVSLGTAAGRRALGRGGCGAVSASLLRPTVSPGVPGWSVSAARSRRGASCAALMGIVKVRRVCAPSWASWAVWPDAHGGAHPGGGVLVVRLCFGRVAEDAANVQVAAAHGGPVPDARGLLRGGLAVCAGGVCLRAVVRARLRH